MSLLTNFAPEMNKKNLYSIAALIWGIPGIIITVKGIRAFADS